MARRASRSPRRAPSFRTLRPWLFPALAVAVAIWLWDFGFDRDALRDELAAGRIDAALARLHEAHPADLSPALAEVEWYPRATRQAAVAELLSRPEDELLEDPRLPTFVAPLDRFRSAPQQVRLREPLAGPLTFRIESLELGLPVTEETLPAGTAAFPLSATLIPGTRYVMNLAPPDGGGLLAYAGFSVLPVGTAREVGLAMAEAHALAPDEPTGDLLASLVALQHGLTDEAATRLRALADDARLGPVATELLALALDEQGLDRTARALLAGR